MMTDKKISGKQTLYDKYNQEIRSNVVFGIVATLVLLILVLVIVANNFIFIKVYVSGSSMVPTLSNGDVVSVNRYLKADYGDVVIISDEKDNGDWLIKRAIAFGGDTVKIEDGYVWLKKSGETEFIKLSEPYLSAEGITFYPNVGNSHDRAAHLWNIGEGEVFYLGDNRKNSRDSRSDFGTCEESQIVGIVSDFAIKTKEVNKFFAKIAEYINKLFG